RGAATSGRTRASEARQVLTARPALPSSMTTPASRSTATRWSCAGPDRACASATSAAALPRSPAIPPSTSPSKMVWPPAPGRPPSARPRFASPRRRTDRLTDTRRGRVVSGRPPRPDDRSLLLLLLPVDRDLHDVPARVPARAGAVGAADLDGVRGDAADGDGGAARLGLPGGPHPTPRSDAAHRGGGRVRGVRADAVRAHLLDGLRR